ncbi:MAG TPA: aldehyde dehydrogenase [Candidatus Onthoplasma faecigallinarum]|nr:aldehyde dehydrogenase [Candidatus Onthoplasma faecigallinarum]
MDNQSILEKIDNQRKFLDENPMLDYKKRIEALKLLYKNIKLMSVDIYDALKKDLNKSETETYMVEIGMVLNEISYMIKHIRSFSRPKRVATPLAQFHSKSYKMPCAYGMVLIISPWNYPFMLALEPMVDAIAAGNSVIVKPSEISPNVSDVIAKLISKTFDKGHVDTVLGGVEECTFLLDQDFDYIFYTGSTRVGEIVMKKAAEHFTPVTLEMGGKSPCIVDKTANIPLAAKRIVFGKFLNAGQTCVAPDYILCDKKIKDKLIDELERQIVLQYTVDPIKNDAYPKMINKKQFDAMSKFITDENLIFGGKKDEESLKIEPTLLNSTFDDDVMQIEIFGPILPIITFDDIDEAIAKINSLSKPLALYIFSSSKTNQNKVLNRCQFGGGCINDTIIHIATPNLGFGGLKQSGIGAYHGKIGFDTFTHYKSIVDKKTWLDLPMRYQPYNKFKQFLIKMFLR